MKLILVVVYSLLLHTLHHNTKTNYNLLLNGNFEQNSHQFPLHWSPDHYFQREFPHFVKNFTDPENPSMQSQSIRITSFRPFLLTQGVFVEMNPTLGIKSSLKLSYYHMVWNVRYGAIATMMLSIRYADGTILPVWRRVPMNHHAHWMRDCVKIPFRKPIVEVIVGIGARYIRPLDASHRYTFGVYFDNISLKMEGEDLKNYEKCEEIHELTPLQNFQIIPFRFNASIPTEKNDLSIVTQLTKDRIPNLTKLAEIYNGPISACIYVDSLADVEVFKDQWIDKYPVLKKHVSFHIVIAAETNQQRGLDSGYPVNLLRNVAKKYAETDYILYLDVDFVVPQNFRDSVKDGKIRKVMDYLATYTRYGRAALVLPAFEFISKYTPVRDRQHLLQLWDNNTEIRRIPYISHDLIDYERFANLKNLYSEEEEFYKLFITQHSYEPYFIAPRLSPLFSERFMGCGRDKLQQTSAMILANYEFFVWKKHFIVHVPHSATKAICPSFPPPGVQMLYVTFATSAMYHEFQQVHKLDFENENKETVLLDPDEMFEKFLQTRSNEKTL